MTNSYWDANDRRRSFGLLLTTVLAPIFGALYAGWTGAIVALAVWLVFVSLPRAFGIHLAKFLYGFVEPDALPSTMVNFLLAVMVGSLIFGIDVAFYAALIGVSVVVLTLIVMVLEPDTQPEAVPVKVRDDRPSGH